MKTFALGFVKKPLSQLVKASIATSLIGVTQVAFAEGRSIEEIVVTAQKRAESSQDIPVAITAIGASQIENLGIADINDVTKLSPSLTITTGSTKQDTSVRIRGIGTDVYSIGIEPTVAIVIDDISQVQPGQALANLVDIERIEILRGPQSVLFGKNASGGLVNVVTKGVADELEGFIEVSATDDHEQIIKGSISGPLSDNAGFRITAYNSDLDGYIENLTTGNDLHEDESKGIRGKFFWQATDDLDLTLSVFASENESNCCVSTLRFISPTALYLGALPFSAGFPGITASDSNREHRLDEEQDSKTDDVGANLKAEWSLGEHTATYIGGYNKWEFENTQDVDSSDFNLLAALTGGALNGGLVQGGVVETDFISHELRIASPESDSFEYIAGIYYANAETDRSFKRGPAFAASWAATSETESLALFGNATWYLGESTRLNMGARVNREEITVEFNDMLANTIVQGDDSETELLGKISLQHDVGEDTMLFASVASGYKGQGYDISSGFSQDKADNPVGSESSISFEVGAKGTYLDGLLQLSTTAFHTSYDDYQAQDTQLSGGVIVLSVENVGKLETRGVELEGIALVGEHLTLNFGAAWIDATIDEWGTAPCNEQQIQSGACEAGFQDLSGEDLNNSPDFKFNIGGQYDIPFESQPFDAFVNFNYTWQDDVLFDLKGSEVTSQDSYGIANLSIGIADNEDERYKLTLFVNNLFDEEYAAYISDQLTNFAAGAAGTGTVTTQILPRGSQRYAGIRLRIGF